MFHSHLDCFQKPPLGGRPSTKPSRHHGTPNAHNGWWFIPFYHVWGPAWIEIHWNSHLVEGLVTYDFTLHLRIRDHTTWRCVGTALGHFLLGSHNFTVTALGSCVEVALIYICQWHVHIRILGPKYYKCGTPLSCKEASMWCEYYTYIY